MEGYSSCRLVQGLAVLVVFMCIHSVVAAEAASRARVAERRLGNSSAEKPPTKFEYYMNVYEDGAILETKNGASESFGYSTYAFNLKMTSEESPTSRVVGMVKGVSVMISGADAKTKAWVTYEELLNTLVIDDGKHRGSLAQHGLLAIPSPPIRVGAPPSEIAIVGGTGDFRCAHGYAIRTVVHSDPPSSLIYKWTVHLSYAPACTPSSD